MVSLETFGSWLLAFVAGGVSVGGVVAWSLARANRYFDAYLDQKGKQLATKEDLVQLLDQQRATAQAVESVKASISGELWIAQERWKLKRDTYAALLETLLKLSRGNEEAPRLLAALEKRPGDPDLTARFRSLAVELRPLSDQLYLHTMLAGLWLDDEATGALKQLVRDLNSEPSNNDAARFDSVSRAAAEAAFRLQRIAGPDLGYLSATRGREPLR